MLPAKKQKIDLCESLIYQIDIASENLLLENPKNEDAQKKSIELESRWFPNSKKLNALIL